MSGARVKAGDVLGGKFRVERVLGAGGMGMVVAARHLQLGQRVALKFMLKEAMADPSNAERFAREARSAVRLQSPHTARVLDVGKLKNGEPYMVMEYLDGQDLDEVLRRNGPMPPHMAVGYMLQACEAFAEAHTLGMVHRDIKPKNLFLTQTVDGRPLVKVLDFGLAKTIGAMGDVSLTATSVVFGSPQYMSPEQMRSAKDVDTRSDIWSIGVCLYELLTGHVPFDAGGVPEICAMVLKDPVEPPSKWARGLPPELDAVVVRCLAKDPRERFQTVAELAFALEPWTANEGSARRILHVMQTVQKTDIPTLMNAGPGDELHQGPRTMDAWDSGERTRKTARRIPPLALAVGICGVLGCIGLVSIVAYATRTKHAPSAATASASDSTTSAPMVLEAEPTPVPVPVPHPTPVAEPSAAAAEPAGVTAPPPAMNAAPTTTTATKAPPLTVKAPPPKPPAAARPALPSTAKPSSKPNPADRF